jgi:hypothetical protein
MQPRGTIDINLTLKAWADIVISKLKNNIDELDVRDLGNLDDSIIHTLLINAGTDIDKIEFSFKMYGIYVDMGVGKEFSRGNSGDTANERGISSPKRKPKEWFSRKYYGQVMKLREILMEKYSKAITYSMMNTLQADFDQRYSDQLHSITVGNLRTVVYRNKSNSRTKRNYNRRRQLDGRWTNDYKTWKPGRT